MKDPINVCVTGAAGQIAYSLVIAVGKGLAFGDDQPVNLRLLDLPMMASALEGVIMELRDCALPLLREITPCTDPMVAFKDLDAAMLVGAMPRKEGMERKDLLKANANIFEGQGKALDAVAKKTVKVVVVGNPANTNAMIASKNAPSIPKENFTALTRLDHNRAAAQVAMRCNVPVNQVKNVIIWGNHSSTQYPDVSHGTVEIGGVAKPIKEAINDDAFLQGEFIKCVQQRGAAIIKARKLSSAMSAANATANHMRSWFLGTPEGEWVSMGVPSDGSYGIAPGIVYSYPVKTKNGTYEIVQGLEIDDFSRQKMKATEDELRDERKQALGE
eukprot:Clim_evm16s198 gene=Clim_evmTU16s198